MNQNIECHSIPVISESKNKKDKTEQILSWWKLIEQRSLHLSLNINIQFILILQTVMAQSTPILFLGLYTQRTEAKERIEILNQ